MTMQHSFEMPDQAEIERHIAQAHAMRSAYMANAVQAAMRAVRSFFAVSGKAAKSA